ncbi:hypothetical protein YC2023_048888 [Brassica napus]
MAKKKKPKSHSPGCSPTGSTNSSSLRSSAQSAPASVDLTANKVSSSEVLPPPDNSSLPVSEPKQDQQASDPPRSEPPILDSEPETVESPLKHPLAIECGDTQALSCHEKSPSAMADENNNTVTGQEQMVTLTPPVPETNPPQNEAKLQSTVWRDKVKAGSVNLEPHDINSCPKNNADKRSEKRKGKAPIHSQLPIVTGSGNPPARVSSEDLRKKHSSVKKTSSQWVRTNSVMQLPKERINLDPPLGSRRNSKSLPISSQHPLSDQDKDKFCIDLKASLFDSNRKCSVSPSITSESESEPESLTNDEDTLDEDREHYTTVISNRKKKLLRAAARAGGPLNL